MGISDRYLASLPDESPLKSPQKAPLKSSSPSKLNAPVSPVKSSVVDVQTPTKKPTKYSIQEQKYYDFMCRVAEAKKWIESIIDESLPNEMDLISNSLRDGIALATLTHVLEPKLCPQVYKDTGRLNFKHTQNINAFFALVDSVNMPDLFRFELTDLYDKKNIPKVFECLHALACLVEEKYGTPAMKNLTGSFKLENDDLKKVMRMYPNIPNFRSFSPTKKETKKMEYTPYKGRKVANPLFRAESPVKIQLPEPVPQPAPEPEPIEETAAPKTVERHPVLLQETRPLVPTSPVRRFDDFRVSRSYSPSRYYNSFSYSPTRRARMNEEEFLDIVTDIQAICKGALVRYNVFIQKKMLEIREESVRKLQCACRGFILRKRRESPVMTKFQALAKGALVRNRIDMLRYQLVKRDLPIIYMQSHIRGVLRRRLVSRIHSSQDPLTSLQAIIKGQIVRNHIQDTQLVDTTSLQANVRGWMVRRHLKSVDDRTIVKLQSHIRAAAVRKIATSRHSIIQVNSRLFQLLGALAKGYIVRQQVLKLDTPESIVKLQALCKGVLVRFALDLVNDVVESKGVLDVQCRIRGALVRSEIRKKQLYWRQNTHSVVRIQSGIRSFITKRAYYDLFSGHTSLETIRRFIDYYKPSNVSQLKQQIDASIHQNDSLMSQMLQLQKKVQLLQKDGATTDLSQYEKLFYLLQVDSQYIMALFKNMEPVRAMSLTIKCFFKNITTLEKRECILYMSLVGDMLEDYIDEHDLSEFFLPVDEHPWKMLLRYYVETQQRDHLVDSYGWIFKMVHGMEFESDPILIYERLHHRTVSSSHEAINDPHTSQQFVKNLGNLWMVVERIFDVFRNTQSLPVELRYVATRAFIKSQEYDVDRLDQLSVIANILVEQYVKVLMRFPGKFGIQVSDETLMKLDQICKVLCHVFTMQPFHGYLEPLNQYAATLFPEIESCLIRCTVYDIQKSKVIYHDLCSEHSPTVTLKSQDIEEIRIKLSQLELAKIETVHLVNNITTLSLNPGSYRLSHEDNLFQQVLEGISYMIQVQDDESSLVDLLTSEILPNDEAKYSQMSSPFLKNMKTYKDLKQFVLERAIDLQEQGVISLDDHFQEILNGFAHAIRANPHEHEESLLAVQTLEQLQLKHGKLKNRYNMLNKALKEYFGSVNHSSSNSSSKRMRFIQKLKEIYARAFKDGNQKHGTLKFSCQKLYEMGVLVGGQFVQSKQQGFFNSNGSLPKVNFTFTSGTEGFTVEVKDVRDKFTLDQLLNAQVDGATDFKLGANIYSSSNLLDFITENFYSQ